MYSNIISMKVYSELQKEPRLKLKTLTQTHLHQVANFLMRRLKLDLIQDEDSRLKKCFTLYCSLIAILKFEWSFGIWKNQELIGLYLQVDLIDYMQISSSLQQFEFSHLFEILKYHKRLSELSMKSKRGDYLLTLYNIFSPEAFNSFVREQVSIVFLGFQTCKLGGWRNIIFDTYNPYPFLRINASILEGSKKGKILEEEKNYMVKIKFSQMEISPFFQKPQFTYKPLMSKI